MTPLNQVTGELHGKLILNAGSHWNNFLTITTKIRYASVADLNMRVWTPIKKTEMGDND